VSVQEVSESFESLRRRMKNVLEVIDLPMSQWPAPIREVPHVDG
jgi:hypothetical protein